jgi:hypothetical protein
MRLQELLFRAIVCSNYINVSCLSSVGMEVGREVDSLAKRRIDLMFIRDSHGRLRRLIETYRINRFYVGFSI